MSGEALRSQSPSPMTHFLLHRGPSLINLSKQCHPLEGQVFEHQSLQGTFLIVSLSPGPFCYVRDLESQGGHRLFGFCIPLFLLHCWNRTQGLLRARQSSTTQPHLSLARSPSIPYHQVSPLKTPKAGVNLNWHNRQSLKTFS